MSHEKLCDLFQATMTRLWSGQWFLCHAHVFQGNICPKSKKTTTDGNLFILCKACWAWMMWQGIIYGWLHLNWICSPFTSFLPFYVPPCFQGLDLIQPTSSFGQKDPSFVFFLKRPSFMVSILGLVLQWHGSAYPPSLLYWPGHKSDSCGHRVPSLRPLKMTPDGNWSLFRLTFGGYEDISCSSGSLPLRPPWLYLTKCLETIDQFYYRIIIDFIYSNLKIL